jgi:hypothetical protein
VEKLETKDWDRFVSSNPASSIFHGSAWREILVRQGLEPLYLAAIDNGGGVQAVCPFFASKALRGVANVLVSIPLSDVGGPLFADGANKEEVLSSFAGFLRSMVLRRRIGMTLTNGIGTPEAMALPLGNAEVSCTGGFFISDLVQIPTEAIWSTIFTKQDEQRKKIRRLEKEGFSSSIASSEAEFLSFCKLHDETVKRAGGTGHNLDLLTDIWTSMHPKNFNLALVKNGDEIVAGVGFFTYPEQRQVHTMYGAYSRAVPNKYGVYLLANWKTLTWAQENQYKEVNFGSTPDDISHPSHKFKAQFGGRYVKKYQVKITSLGLLSNPIVRRLTRASTRVDAMTGTEVRGLGSLLGVRPRVRSG